MMMAPTPPGSGAAATPAQEETVLRAIVVSSSTHWAGRPITQRDRQDAFGVLRDFSSSFGGRVALCLSWLERDRLTAGGGGGSGGNTTATAPVDCTVSAKLYACEILAECLRTQYTRWEEGDRLRFRRAVLLAAHSQARTPLVQATTSGGTATADGGSSPSAAASLPLANKLASLLAGLVVRDFPQRWPTCMDDLFSQLWSTSTAAEQVSPPVGNKMCLQVLQLVAEDCTDSDFNSKISTKRRNDILIGLNEVSDRFLPLLFRSLEQISTLAQARSSIHQMRIYLISNQVTISTMTTEQAVAYRTEEAKIQGISSIMFDTLQCLEKFCQSMPLEWMLGNPQLNFCAAFFHLMREPTGRINVMAVECLEQLAVRGKLTYSQWIHWIRDLPGSVAEANQLLATQEVEYVKVRAAALTGQVPNNSNDADPLVLQLDFHRALSRMLATVLSSHIAHMTVDKDLLKPPSNNQGEQRNVNSISFTNYLGLLVQILQHPSGRVAGEQLNIWIAMLRDPQISKSTNVIDPFVSDILNCFINHMVRLDWDDVDAGVYPRSALLQESWEDEDDYDAWINDYRSKSSQLFKYLSNYQPHMASSVVTTRLRTLLNQHGTGEPLDHMSTSNQQLTQESTAVRQIEGIIHPLENTLSGLPTWALNERGKSISRGHGSPQQRQKEEAIRAQTRSSLSELANIIVCWNPTFLWLKFRRAQLLECLRHYWMHNSQTLLEGVDSLLKYIGAPDEWGETTLEADGTERVSAETVSLRKRSSMALVAISKMVPDRLVPWLSQLSDATRNLLSTTDLLQTNRMHLYEFLSVVATAVEDPIQRANFIENVLADALNILQSAETQQALASVDSFLASMGIAQAATYPGSVTDATNVKAVTDRFSRIFSAFNEMLSVGRRCHEAAKKRPNGGVPSVNGIPDTGLPQGMSITDAADSLTFPDEGPVSIRDLSVDDPFVPLWPRILPPMLRMLDIIFKMWRPEQQTILLRDRVQRFALAISDDDAFMSRKTDGKNGGVFGEGGTAGSIISGTDRRDMNLAPRWSIWFNELRNSLLQMLGLLAGQRVLYAPEIAEFFPQFVAVVADPENLRSMEHRHCSQYLKQFIEVLLLSCPPPLYPTHLAPIVSPVFEHVQYRLEKSWEPILQPPSSTSFSVSSKAISTADCEAASALASQGGETWYASYYARSGLFVGDLDFVTAEAAVEKYRVDVTRIYSDVLQSALALKGEWALVLANLAKEDDGKRKGTSDSSSLSGNSKALKGPAGRLPNFDGVKINADGTPKNENQSSIDARRLKRIMALNHFLFLENESIAGFLTLTVIQCLAYPDGYTCRRITRICHRVLETVAWHPRYTDLLGRRMLAAALKNVVTEPKWMVGVEWDMINVVRDIYCRLVLGQSLQPGGQGAGLQQNTTSTGPTLAYEQVKSADRPLQGGGILTAPSDIPHELLVSLPGISVTMVQKLDADLQTKRSPKEQKEVIRDFLRVAADQWKENEHPNAAASRTTGNGSLGVLDRAVAEESLLHGYVRKVDVEDIPETLVVTTKAQRKQTRKQEEAIAHQSSASVGLAAFSLSS